MEQVLGVVASTWKDFVESLKANQKLGFGVCQTTNYSNGFFSARLVTGVDKTFEGKLKEITGDEVSGVIDILQGLCQQDITQPAPTIKTLLLKDADADIVIKKPRKSRKTGVDV